MNKITPFLRFNDNAEGKPLACGWLTDKFGLCWQIVPEKIGEAP